MAHDEEHPKLRPAATDPAELAWHLYRHHGLDLAGLAGTEPSDLWSIHDADHEDE